MYLQRSRKPWLWGIVALLMLGVLLGGVVLVRHEERTLRQEAENQLEAIAELKANQIAAWRAERLGDAMTLMESPFIGPSLAGWLATGDPAEAARLLEQFRSLKEHYGYDDILLVDAQGNVRLSWSGALKPLESEAAEAVARALAEKHPVLTDLHLAADGRTPHLGAVAPLYAAGERGGTPLGAVILQMRADRFLYPLIQSWPVPSETAETLLVHREGESALFLNDLRHRPGWALALRIPLSHTEMPVVQAALGKEGFFEGRDDRNVRVLSFIKAVPNSPWYVIAKIDAHEALGEWRFRIWMLSLLTIGLVLMVAAAGALIAQRAEVRHQRALAQAEAALHQVEAGYHTTLLSVGDAVIVTDLAGRVTLMNPVAEALTGWARAEAAGRPLGEIFAIMNEETHAPVENPVSRVLREGGVAGLGNHTLLLARDGREIPIADSGAPIRDEAGTMSGVVLVFRDQTAERTHLRQLMALNCLGQALARSNDLGAIFRAVCEHLPRIVDCPNLLISLWDEETRTLRAAYALADGKPQDVSAFPPLSMREDAPLEGRRRALIAQQPVRMESLPAPSEGGHLIGAVDEAHIPHSALYVPMVVEGRTLGLLEVQSYREGAYTEREVALLIPAANQIGLAIQNTRLLESLQAERDMLARERSLLRTVLDHLPGPVYIYDHEGRLQISNRADCEANGWREEDVLGQTALDLFPGEVGERTHAENMRLLQTGDPILNREERFVTPEGEVRWFLNSKIPFRDASGRIAGLVGIVHDITPVKEAVEALIQSEEEKSLILDNVSERFLYLGPDLRVHLANKAAADSVNQHPRDLLGRYCYEIWHGRAEPCGNCPVLRARATGHIEEGEVESEDGHIYHHRAYPIVDKRGEIEAFVEFVREVTRERQLERERLALEAQLRQAQKMEAIGRLAGGIAHDYNNMLQSILGYTQLALEETPEDHPLRMYLEEIQSAGRRSATLTRQLLAFARRQTITPEVLDLNAYIEEMLKMLRRLIGENIILRWFPAQGGLHVFMDPSQISQILANLVVNARDAIADAGTITIKTADAEIDEAYTALHAEAAPGRYVVLSVSDTGCGMTEEVKAHLFEPFFTTKPLGQGTGLGLATVYGIVKQNGGFINVYSEPGLGATFRLYLPRYDVAAREASEKATPRPLPLGQETILLVEDEMTLLQVGSQMLKRLGYTVLAANSPEEALRLAQEYEGEIHLLITDVVMPTMNGRQLAEHLHALRPNIKCLYTSGYTANIISHAGVLDEGVRFIPKPFSLESLAAQVREALEG